MSERVLVVHCPEPWQREALYSLCLTTFAPGIRRFDITPHYPYQILGHVPGEIHGNDERGHPDWAAATGAPDPVPFGDVTLAQLRTALGLDEPEPEPVELPDLGDWECRIDGEDLVVGCQYLDLEEVDAFVAAYQAARGRQAQEVRLSNGLRLRLEVEAGGEVANLRAKGPAGSYWAYVMEVTQGAAKLLRACGVAEGLQNLLPLDDAGQLKVEDYRTGQRIR